MIIDGKSSDGTLEIAKKYGCKIIINTKVDQVYAKHLGYLMARGKYLMFLDSDEVLESSLSINLKVEEMQSNPELKAVMFDLPGTLETTREFVQAAGLSSRVEFQTGDFNENEIKGIFDVCFLFKVNQKQCQKAGIKYSTRIQIPLSNGPGDFNG